MSEPTQQPQTAAVPGKRGSIVKMILLGLAVFIVGFVIVVALQPSTFHVERSAVMNAPPEAVFAQVNDFHNWDAWSPWAKLDPDAKNSFEGTPEGEGAVFHWSGNSDVGEGRMTVTESRPYERIKIRLDFIKPFEDTSRVEFVFKPQGDQTAVTWTIDGEYDFFSKAFCLFMDMNKMIGDKYEEGLASLKSIVEKGTAPPAETPAPETTS
jgi:hypothetical protein